MKKKLIKKTKIYSVDWYRGDWCYRTTTECTWQDVLECKRTAKLLGEKVKYQHYRTREEDMGWVRTNKLSRY